MISSDNTPNLDNRSRKLRELIIRALAGGQRGHIGSSMSLVEIIRVLYDDFLKFNSAEPMWDDRDRFILSKGHGCLALYAILVDKGFIPVEELDRFCHEDGILGGHPEKDKVPGIEASTGALGHGLPIAVGMAIASRLKNMTCRIVVVVGDGEINEGAVWEAALSASKHKLSNLSVFIDYNKIQSYGFTKTVVDLEPLSQKWEAFGFGVTEVDGHDISALKALTQKLPLVNDRPSAIICHTIKGKGISYAENNPMWHHKSKISAEEIKSMYDSIKL